MEILEYESKYDNDIKNLLEELQEYIISIDPYHFNVMKNDYKEKIYERDMNEVKKYNGKIYLALDSSEIVGLIIGVVRKPLIEFDYERLNNMGEVIELVVTKKTRSRGIGYQLLDKMEKYFKEQNCLTVNIDVFGYNDIGQNFYFKNGYHNRMMTVSKKIDKN